MKKEIKDLKIRFLLIMLFFLIASGVSKAQVNPYANNAFDDNMKVVDSVLVMGQYQYIFAIYSGDMNQDGQVDQSDFPYWDNDNTFGNYGYLVSDLNGDGNVDLSDFPFWDNNNTTGVYSHRP